MRPRPFSVWDWKDVTEEGQRATKLGEFDTEDEAATFISNLPNYEYGRYSLDGPPDDWDEYYTGWVNDHNIIRWQERSDP